MNSASLRANVTEILHSQIKYLICLPPMLPKTVMLDLPEDQHRVVNTIIQNLGPISKKKCPYFFITGSEYLLLMKSQWSQFHYLHSFQTYLHRSSNIWRHKCYSCRRSSTITSCTWRISNMSFIRLLAFILSILH